MLFTNHFQWFSPNSLFGLFGLLIPIILAGFFTLRSNVARIWKENYEAQLEENKNLQLSITEQRELKHNALSEIAALEMQLQQERTKTDMTPVTTRLDEIKVVLESMVTRMDQPNET